MKRIAVLVAVVALIGFLALAQSKSQDKSVQQSGGAMMNCPMMAMMSSTSTGQTMQGMPQRMAGMFALSSEEIAKLLADKKAALGLSDAQVKSIADLVASSQEQKAGEKMQSMMSQMQNGKKCPCMQGGAK